MNELQVQRLKMAVLQLAADHDADSADVVAAIADVLAVTAATLDRQLGVQSLQDRLHAFCGRVEVTYERVSGLYGTEGKP